MLPRYHYDNNNNNNDNNNDYSHDVKNNNKKKIYRSHIKLYIYLFHFHDNHDTYERIDNYNDNVIKHCNWHEKMQIIRFMLRKKNDDNNHSSSSDNSKINNYSKNANSKHTHRKINSYSDNNIKHQNSDDNNANNKIHNEIEIVRNQQLTQQRQEHNIQIKIQKNKQTKRKIRN